MRLAYKVRAASNSPYINIAYSQYWDDEAYMSERESYQAGNSAV